MAKQKKRRLKKKYRVLRGIYAAVVAVAAVIVIGYGVYKVAVPAPEMKPAAANATQEEEVAPGMEQGSHTRREQTYTFLLACPDQVSGNADAIMLVTYDVPNQKIGMLSVPRDTLVDESSPKINSSLHGGIENLQDVVSDLVGYPIDFYITIDLDGFVELVDAVGGVEFDVPVEMYYSDPTQDLNIFFQPGMQHLDGQAAMIQELFPDAKTVGLLYCSAEPNSQYQVDTVQGYLEDLGYTCTQYSFSDSNDLSAVASSACTASDVLYVPTDNTAANNAELIGNISLDTGTPIIAGEEGICKGCGVATLTISYYDIGYKTGEMAYDILVNGADPATMPIEYAPQFTPKYNPTMCEALGLTPPDGYEAIAE